MTQDTNAPENTPEIGFVYDGHGLTSQQVDFLMQPLHPGRVKHRTQGGANLSYIEAFDAKATLIRVFGFAGFDVETTETKILDVREVDGKISVTAMARVQLRIHATGATYSEVTAATQTGRVYGEVADFALKTCASDALKRCCINLGSQFGLSLYQDGYVGEIVRIVVAPGQERYPAPKAPMSEDVRTQVERATATETVDAEVVE